LELGQDKVIAVKALDTILSSNTPFYARDGHELWMKLKLEAGWTLGPFSNENKTHPSLVPFDQLPPSEVLKDLTWEAMIRAFRSQLHLL